MVYNMTNDGFRRPWPRTKIYLSPCVGLIISNNRHIVSKNNPIDFPCFNIQPARDI